MKHYGNRRSRITFAVLFLCLAVLSSGAVTGAWLRNLEQEEAEWNRRLEQETERTFIYLEQHLESAVSAGNSIFSTTWYSHYRNVAGAYREEFNGLKRLEVVNELQSKVVALQMVSDILVVTPSLDSVICRSGCYTMARWQQVYGSQLYIDASQGFTRPATLRPTSQDVCVLTLQDFNSRREKSVVALLLSKESVLADVMTMLSEDALRCTALLSEQTLVDYGENKPESISFIRESRALGLRLEIAYPSYQAAGRGETTLTYAALLLAMLCASALLALLLTRLLLRPIHEMILSFGGQKNDLDNPYQFIYAYVDAFAKQTDRQSRENNSLRTARRHFLSLMRNEIILGMLTNPEFDFTGEYVRAGFPWFADRRPFLIAACTPKEREGGGESQPPAEQFLRECANSCYAGFEKQWWYLYWFEDEEALDRGRELLESRLEGLLWAISEPLHAPQEIHGAYLALRDRLEEEKRRYLSLPTALQGRLLSRIYAGRREEAAQTVAEALNDYTAEAVLWLLVQVAGDCGFDAGDYLLRYRTAQQEGNLEQVVCPLLTELAQALCRFQTADRPSVAAETAQEICRCIREHFDNPEMSVNFLADQFSMHRTLISKAVKAQTGETFSDYLLKMRMQRARELLEGEEALTLQQVGEQIGLLSYPTFKRAFVKTYGCTPGEWHKNA